MNIGEKYFDFAASAEEVSDLDLSSIVSVRLASFFLRNALTMGTK